MIVAFFHNLISSWFPKGTDDFIQHFIVMGVLSIPIYYFIEEFWKTIKFILVLATFIELDQAIFKTGTCELIDIWASFCGAAVFLLIFMYIRKDK